MKIFILFFISIVIVSCNVLPKSQLLKVASSPIELGVIGKQSRNIKKTDYEIFAIPTYKHKIKVAANIITFNQANYNKYLKSIEDDVTKKMVTYVDSLPQEQKPQFIDLQIIDKLVVIASLNEENPSVFNYLKKQEKASLVSKVRVVLVEEDLKKFKNADTFYLQTIGNKQQYLLMFKNNKFLGNLNLYGIQTFGYDLSSFCWEIRGNKSVKIATMVPEGQNCVRGTNKDAQYLEEELINNRLRF